MKIVYKSPSSLIECVNILNTHFNIEISIQRKRPSIVLNFMKVPSDSEVIPFIIKTVKSFDESNYHVHLKPYGLVELKTLINSKLIPVMNKESSSYE